MMLLLILNTLFFSTHGSTAYAQDNYEIQVYGSELMPPQVTMVELHSNFTFATSKLQSSDLLPTDHVFHETVEVTRGINPWMEVGVYFFNSIGSEDRTTYVGSHICPRFSVPESEHLPVGLSISFEFGFQKKEFCQDDWTLEIRPIIDKSLGPWYFAFNPTFDHSLHGDNSGAGFIFSPNFKAGYSISPVVAPGVEYYGTTGPIFAPSPVSLEQHQIFGVIDLNFSSEWEFNAGYGVGLTDSSARSILKIILGRRF